MVTVNKDKTSEALNIVGVAADRAVEKIAAAADKASSAIASAARDAATLLASQASSAAKVVDVKQGNDHDLLLEVKTIQNIMLLELREIKTGTSQRISELQQQKLDIEDSYPVVYKAGVDNSILCYGKQIAELEVSKIRITVLMGIASVIMSTLITLVVYHMFK